MEEIFKVGDILRKGKKIGERIQDSYNDEDYCDIWANIYKDYIEIKNERISYKMVVCPFRINHSKLRDLLSLEILWERTRKKYWKYSTNGAMYRFPTEGYLEKGKKKLTFKINKVKETKRKSNSKLDKFKITHCVYTNGHLTGEIVCFGNNIDFIMENDSITLKRKNQAVIFREHEIPNFLSFLSTWDKRRKSIC